MTYKKSKRKNQVKSIATAVISIALVVAVIAGLGVLFTRETKRVSPTVFSVGGMNAAGEYVKVTNSIYTKDFIECDGLAIEPDFEAQGTYQVFYYDENKQFIGATDVMDSVDGVYNKAETYLFAHYCRITITPEIVVEDEEESEVVKEAKIRFWEVAQYANDYKITVNREQKPYRLSGFVPGSVRTAKKWTLDEENVVIADATGIACFDAMLVEGEKTLCISLGCSGKPTGELTLIFADEDGVAVGESLVIDASTYLTNGLDYYVDNIAIPKGAYNCYVNCSNAELTLQFYFK